MIRPLHLSLLGLAVLQGSCTPAPGRSYVAALRQPDDAAILADGMAAFVATQMPASAGTLALAPTRQEQDGNALTPALADALRQHGFAVTEGDAAPAAAHRLRYLVAPLDNGELVRLTLDGATQGAQFFVRTEAGTLQAGGPCSLLQAGTAP